MTKLFIVPLGKGESDMERYIDVGAFGIGRAKRELFTIPEYADGWNDAIKIIENAPTADVVPRAEVDEWKEIAETYQHMFEEAKTEVAREIFADIEKTLNEAILMMALQPSEYKEGSLSAAMGLSELVKELKQKYGVTDDAEQ